LRVITQFAAKAVELTTEMLVSMPVAGNLLFCLQAARLCTPVHSAFAASCGNVCLLQPFTTLLQYQHANNLALGRACCLQMLLISTYSHSQAAVKDVSMLLLPLLTRSCLLFTWLLVSMWLEPLPAMLSSIAEPQTPSPSSSVCMMPPSIGQQQQAHLVAFEQQHDAVDG
jgi:hypothetical protein